jgi:6-phosphofructokinase 1
MTERKKSVFNARMTDERRILRDYLERRRTLPTDVKAVGKPEEWNRVSEEEVGAYRPPKARKAVTADMDLTNAYQNTGERVPSFLEAGPRQRLFYDPGGVRAAIVTSGGVAPGVNCVVHSIVARHSRTYSINPSRGGGVIGIHDGFVGLYEKGLDKEDLDPDTTERWLDRGGSVLGARRFWEVPTEALTTRIAENLHLNQIDILYVIGGDGSLTVAHEVAKKAKDVCVVGIPKTMDNDVLWVWQSFGFNTAVEKAAEVINVMHSEAESTRRVCIIELFGAESGFVAANAALASGHTDLVLVPETFFPLSRNGCRKLLEDYIKHLGKAILGKERAHAVVVLAEGVAELLKQRKVIFEDQAASGADFSGQLRAVLQRRLEDKKGRPVDVFVNQPRHHIRAVPPNAHDAIYCERLGALAVDSALAGYTDFMISQWLTEYVLVPLEMAVMGQKSIPPGGIFWKEVVASTGQPHPKRAYHRRGELAGRPQRGPGSTQAERDRPPAGATKREGHLKATPGSGSKGRSRRSG